MSDILNEIFSDWAILAARAQRGEPVKKAEVLRLLDTDQPIPESAKPLIRGLLTKEIPFRRGEVSPLEEIKPSVIMRYLVILDALMRESEPKERLRGDPTPRQLAKEQTAERFSIDTRTLEKWIKEYHEQ